MRSIPIALVLAMCAASGRAAAATPLCVEIRGDESAPLRKLVDSELQRHPTHQVVDEGCTSVLAVELFTVAGVHFLTVRINREVPLRYSFKDPRELADRLTEGVRVALDHDPVSLAGDIGRYSLLQRMSHSVLVRGHNSYRLELYGVFSATADRAALASGGAFSVTRGADHVQVFARLYGAGSPSDTAGGQVLRFHAGGDVGLMLETSARGWSTLYGGIGIGLQVRQFEGRLPKGGVGTAMQVDPVASLRVGARFLRVFDFDVDLFAAGYLPFYPPDPESALLPQAYAPSFIFGMGVGL